MRYNCSEYKIKFMFRNFKKPLPDIKNCRRRRPNLIPANFKTASGRYKNCQRANLFNGQKKIGKGILILALHVLISVLILIDGGMAGAMGTRPKRLDYNLLLITIDTLRPDHLGCYGYKHIKTPHIDSLAARGVLFSQAVTPVPITLPSHSSIMTGLYPVQHGVRNNGNFYLGKDAVTLAEIMKDYGYQTGACVGSFVLDSVFGLDQGFDLYDDYFTPGKKKVNLLYNERKAEEVNKVAIKWLKEHKDHRFFLWIHYFDPHSPYFPPFPYSLEYRSCLYDGEIAYADSCLGKLFKQMDEIGLKDNTVIFLVGDHGEGLGEHNEDTHAVFIYDSTLRVPFIIWAPGLIEAGRNVSAMVSTIDILPTVIDLFGLKPVSGLAGKNLIPLISGKAREVHPQILCESLCPEFNFGWSRLEGLRTPNRKYIQAPQPEIYNLKEDPGEEKNLFQEIGSADHERWKISFDKLKEDYQPATWATQQTKLDPETQQRLRSLGYVWTRAETDTDEERPRPDPKELIHVMNYMDNGISYLHLEEYDKAIEEFQKIVKIDPQNMAGYFHLGWAYEKKEQFDKAEAFFRKILEINPDHSDVYNHLGLIQYIRGNLDLALEEFQRSLDLFEYAEVYYNMSLIYHKKGRIEEAMAAVKKSLELDPDYAESWNHLGNLYLARNNLQEAAQYFEKALELDPGHVTAHNNIGLVYSQRGQIEEAIKQFNEAVRLDPNSAEAHNNLGSLYLGRKRYDQAMIHLEKALAIRPDYQNAIINLGMLYVSLGDSEKAEHLFQKALEIDENSAVAYSQLGYLYLLKKEFDKAIFHYQKVLILKPGDPEAHYYLGKAYHALGQTDEAIKEWQKAIDIQPGSPSVHLNLGNVYFEMGNFQKAQYEWNLALAGKPVDIPGHLVNLGIFYFQSEQYEKAVMAWQKANELKPGDSTLHYNLALAYFKQGQFKAAGSALKECLRLQPDSQNAHMLLEKIRQLGE